MRTQTIVLICLVLVLASPVQMVAAGTDGPSIGSPPQVDWESRIERHSSHFLRKVVQTADGGYLAAGQRGSPGSAPISLVRLDDEGARAWERVLATGDDPCHDVRALHSLADGGFVVAGVRHSCDISDWTAFSVAFDGSGNARWGLDFPGRIVVAIAELGLTEMVLLQNHPSALCDPDTWSFGLTVLSDDGKIIVDTLHSLGVAFSVSDMVTTRDGGLAIYGTLWPLTSPRGPMLVKIDLNGEISWARRIDGPGSSSGRNITELSDGSLLLGGSRIEDAAFRQSSHLLIKTDSEGRVLWERTTAQAGRDVWGGRLLPSSDGGFVVFQNSELSPDDSQSDSCVIRFDAAGFPVWRRPFEEPGDNFFFDIVATADDGWLLTGVHTESPDDSQHVFVKLSPETLAGDAFLRGDATTDSRLDVSDAVRTLNWLFLGSFSLHCHDAADTDDDGTITLGDAIVLLDFLYRGGPAPPPPFPDAGLDPTEDPLGCAR